MADNYQKWLKNGSSSNRKNKVVQSTLRANRDSLTDYAELAERISKSMQNHEQLQKKLLDDNINRSKDEVEKILAKTHDSAVSEPSSERSEKSTSLSTDDIEDENEEYRRKQREAQSKLKDAEVHQAQGDNEKRDQLFKWALSLVTAILIVTVFFMVGYMNFAFYKKNELPEAVMITWMSSTVVEAVGIVLIIARYLFPDGSKEKAKKEEE